MNRVDTPPNQTFSVEWWQAIIGAVVAALGWGWRYVTGNIKELRDNSVTKTDFTAYEARASESRKELRDAIVDLYKGQKDLAIELRDTQRNMTDTINMHHSQLIDAIHESKK